MSKTPKNKKGVVVQIEEDVVTNEVEGRDAAFYKRHPGALDAVIYE